jgi:hypothetical protein
MAGLTKNASVAAEASHTKHVVSTESVAGADKQQSRRGLIDEVRQAPGFSDLKSYFQRDLVRLLESKACDPERRQIKGGWRAVARVLGIKERQTYVRLAAWRDAGLVGWNTGARNVYTDDRRQTFAPGTFPVLPTETTPSEAAERAILLSRRRTAGAPQARTAGAPQATRARVRQAGSTSTSTPKYVKDVVEASLASSARADKAITFLEGRHGKILKRDILRVALLENEDGVRACYQDAKERSQSDSPIGLLITMVEAGEHRNREYTPRAATCSRCGQQSAEVRDRRDDIRVSGFGDPQGEVLACEACAKGAGWNRKHHEEVAR